MKFIDRFKSTWGATSVAAAAGPLGMFAPSLHPPWPTGSIAIAVLVTTSALLLARGRESRQASWEPTLALGFGVVALFGYIACLSAFVVEQPQLVDGTEHTLRFIVGYERLQGVPATDTDLTVLQDALFQVERVWTASSLGVTRVATLGLFCLSFGLIAYGASLMASRPSTAQPG